MSVRIQAGDFDPGEEYAALVREAGTGAGAIVAFVGLVRDFSGDRAISALELEHYPGMAQRVIETLVEAARAKWALKAVRVIHRFGRLEVADRIVLVLVAAEHRASAFSACEFLIDSLKTRAPFWKKESGLNAWVAARDEDEARAARWGVGG